MTNDGNDMDEEMIWVRSDRNLLGDGYMLTINYGPDHAQTMSIEDAYRYAAGILEIVSRAEYDAAMLSQLTEITGEEKAAVELVADIRQRRTPVDMPDISVKIDGGVARSTGPKFRPFVTIGVNDEIVGQWDMGLARQHATQLFDVANVITLDDSYRKALIELAGIPENSANGAVQDLANYRVT